MCLLIESFGSKAKKSKFWRSFLNNSSGHSYFESVTIHKSIWINKRTLTKLRLTEIPKRERNIGVVTGRGQRIGLGEDGRKTQKYQEESMAQPQRWQKGSLWESNSPEGEGRKRNLAV